MRIGVNCIAVDPAYVGGVSSFTLGLLGGLATAGAAHEFRIFASEGNAFLFQRFKGRANFAVEVLDGAMGLLRRSAPKLASFTGSSRFYRLSTDIAFRKLAQAMERTCDVLYTPTTVLRP